MWRETTQYERNQRIFEEEFEDFLPSRILDFHVHVFNEGVLPAGVSYSNAGHDLLRYDLSDLDRDLGELYPNRETAAVCFGMPNIAYDQARNDAYLASACDRKRFFPLRLLDPEADSEASLLKAFDEEGFLGLKPYLNYVRKDDPNFVEIPEMLPDWAMELVDARGLLVMLHIPRSARLADPLNQQQIVDLCTRYPNATIILAHIGRAYYMKNIIGQLERLKDLPNLYYDLAMVNHWEVMEYLFARVAPEKILYATDTPIAVAPGKSVEINHQYTYVTPKPWSLSISDDHGKLSFTSFAYEELRAIKQAVQRLGLGQDFVEGLFYENGMRLLNPFLRQG